MIDIRDLRIGSWIDGIREGSFSMIENGSEIELAAAEGIPIRITDDIIEGIGFIMNHYRLIDPEESNKRFPAFYDGIQDEAICQYYHFPSPHHGIIELRKYCCDVIEVGIGDSIKNPFGSQVITRLNAFHQLQNVFWDVFYLEIGLKEIE